MDTSGAENLPPEGSEDWARPMLFVGNHGKMGFYDTPLLMYELFVRGYRIRGLAHPGERVLSLRTLQYKESRVLEQQVVNDPC